MENRIENIINEKQFSHLHVHTSYSFLDGYNNPKECVKRAKELGMTHIAITDHNHLGGVLDFQKACEEEEISPVLGLEAYWTWDTNILSMSKPDRDALALESAIKAGVVIPDKAKKSDIKDLVAPYQCDTTQYHIVLLAINQIGWSNLVKIQSESSEKCTFNGRYIVDDEILSKYSEGIIMGTACIGNTIPKLIINGRVEEAEEQLLKWKGIFGERFYIEIQPLDIRKQRVANLELVQMAKEHDIMLVATNDVHYTREEDHDDHDTLLCIGIGKQKEDVDRLRYSNDFWIKSYDEMIESFTLQSETMEHEFGDMFDKEDYMNTVRHAMENSNVIANMTNSINLGSDVDLFPNLEIPLGMEPEKYLTMLCFQNLYKYKKKQLDIDLRTYEKRLNVELNVINTKGFAPYILVVEDYIRWANENGCPTGPGRGSGAGSLVLFLLGITKMIDPIKYNLLFFRFLTMDRSSPPDIDTDFEYYNRHRVVEYLERKYDKAKVSQIGTYTVMGVRSGLKDVGRVLGIDYGVMNTLTKKIDLWSNRPDLKFKHLDALRTSDKPDELTSWQEFNNYEKQYPELFRLARAYEGTPRNMGIHASGVLVTPMDVDSLFPTRYKDGVTVTLYTGVQLEELKAIKFDILGLKTLSVIKNTLEAIDETLTFDDLYEMVDVNDVKMFERIQNRETEGLFQIESNLFKGVIEDMVPTNLDDIIALTSICRPGPLSAGMGKQFTQRKHGLEEAVEPITNTWDIVSETYGTIIYQEQIMLIAKRVAGFDDNQSDSHLRKAFAKKRMDKMIMCRQWFIYGKINEEAPSEYNSENVDQPMYDKNGKYGPAIMGGLANGYNEKELKDFWTNIEGFADYLFNKSHAACYSYITALTGWLKTHFPGKFLAALLSVQDAQDKIELYIKAARGMNIDVKAPHINLSGVNFKEVNGDIRFGLGSIKGVGATSIPAIIENRPYETLEEPMEKIGKKGFNKRVGMALIKSGAFDFININRNELINSFYEMRKDKDERVEPEDFDKDLCIAMEKEVLGSAITYIPWWDEIKTGETVTCNIELTAVSEITDKNGNMMAFITGNAYGSEIRSVVFSRTYCANADKFDMNRYTHVILKGKKDDRGGLVVSKVIDPIKEEKKVVSAFTNDLEDRMAGVI
jgi:DNA polymerase-3 subunit alpha